MDLVQTVRKEGSRGGRADFKWEDVKNDTQRENYLGHSVMAPVGRWQKGRDLTWYAKCESDETTDPGELARIREQKLKEEKQRLKEAEENAMLAALGLPVPVRSKDNANLTPLGKKVQEGDVEKAMEEKAAEREGVEKKERRHRERRDDKDGRERKRRHRDRSRSREHRHRRRERSRSHDRRDHRDRSRSRERRRDRSPTRDRHRSRSRDRHARHDKHRHRSPGRESHHRRHRSRSPYDKDERRD